MPRKIIQVDEKVPLHLWFPLSLQHLFAMFGASVLVPSLFIPLDDPNRAGIIAAVLLMNGIGTLLFIPLTKGKAPAYLGSSFAFIAPTLTILGTAAYAGFAYQAALGGFVAVGLAGLVVAAIIWKFGTKWIDVLMPTAAMGPVVALIGLELASTAAGQAGLLPAAGAAIEPANLWVFLITLGLAVFGSVCFRKFFAVIPILIAIVGGYLFAILFRIVDFTPVATAPWFAWPHFQKPIFKLDAMLTMLPALLVVVTEHIGHQLVTGKVIGRDLIKDPGLHRSMLGDYLSSTLSGLVGAVPTTTYGENIGVMAITKVYSVRVIGGAAVISMAIALVGKMTALIGTIPGPVMGGVSFLLYGMIAASGIRVLVDAKVDFSRSRNLVLTAVIFITGLSGISINVGNMQLKGMVLAALVGMVLSLTFYLLDRFGLTNDGDGQEA